MTKRATETDVVLRAYESLWGNLVARVHCIGDGSYTIEHHDWSGQRTNFRYERASSIEQCKQLIANRHGEEIQYVEASDVH